MRWVVKKACNEATSDSGIGDSVDTMERELIRGGFRPTRSERGRQVDFCTGALSV